MARTRDSHMGSFQGYENHVSDLSCPGLYGHGEYHKAVLEVGDSTKKTSEFVKNFGTSSISSDASHSVIHFKSPGYDSFMHNTSGSLLSFEQNEAIDHRECSTWENDLKNYNQLNQHSTTPKCTTNLRLLEILSSHQKASSSSDGSMNNKLHGNDEMFGWFYSETTDHNIQAHEARAASFQKRSYMGENTQALKKQCTSATRKAKSNSVPSKDPQSLAAKNRRERISERLKILQELVPNGCKVDLVTMLEKAISYVKFLQLQVKVLATDEFWPAQGGKAPDISQVKEAIDAILSSQRDRNSSTSE